MTADNRTRDNIQRCVLLSGLISIDGRSPIANAYKIRRHSMASVGYPWWRTLYAHLLKFPSRSHDRNELRTALQPSRHSKTTKDSCLLFARLFDPADITSVEPRVNALLLLSSPAAAGDTLRWLEYPSAMVATPRSAFLSHQD